MAPSKSENSPPNNSHLCCSDNPLHPWLDMHSRAVRFLLRRNIRWQLLSFAHEQWAAALPGTSCLGHPKPPANIELCALNGRCWLPPTAEKRAAVAACMGRSTERFASGMFGRWQWRNAMRFKSPSHPNHWATGHIGDLGRPHRLPH